MKESTQNFISETDENLIYVDKPILLNNLQKCDVRNESCKSDLIFGTDLDMEIDIEIEVEKPSEASFPSQNSTEEYEVTSMEWL